MAVGARIGIGIVFVVGAVAIPIVMATLRKVPVLTSKQWHEEGQK